MSEVVDPVAKLTAALQAQEAKPVDEVVDATEEKADPVEEATDQADEVVEVAEEKPAEEKPAEKPEDADVEIDGETFKVPKKIADAVLKNKDYTQKTQEVANLRRMVEDRQQYQEAAAVIQEQTQQVRQELHALEVQAKQLADLNWGELWQTDPARAGPLHAYRTTLQEQIATKRGELQGAEQRASEAFRTHKAKQLALGQAELERRLGGKKLTDVRSDLAQAAEKYGFGEAEMMSPAAMHALFRAMEMDRLQASPVVAKKVAQAKPMSAPAARSAQSAANVSILDTMKAKAVKSGRSEDVESFLARRIAASKGRRP